MINFSRTVTPSGTLVVQLSGKLDLPACEYFFNCMQDEIDEGHRKIVVNCRELGVLPSAGIGMLVRIRARVMKQGGFIILTDLQNQIADLLHFLHMDKVFQIYPSVSDALKSVDSDSP